MCPAKYLILVKHSLPEILEDVPAREWHLSEEGQGFVRELAGKLLAYQPEIIVSSIEPKARETAAILAEYFGREIHEVDGLHEHDRSGAPYSAKDKFHDHVRELFDKPDELVFGNETASRALLRFRTAVDHVLSLYTDKAIAIVAHGTVIALYISWLTGCDGFDLWKELGLPSFVVLDIQSKILIDTENLV
jgi:broad specificity phosphatase PhoE